jgi:hypothetical protein
MSSTLQSAMNALSDTKDKVFDMYDGHIREKAVNEVNERISAKGLDVNQIATDDYEAMISDLSKDIKQEYAKKTAQGLFAFIGLDFLLGF